MRVIYSGGTMCSFETLQRLIFSLTKSRLWIGRP